VFDTLTNKNLVREMKKVSEASIQINEALNAEIASLVIANKELIFQNEEKEKRAAELVIAKKELEFQNEEKEKRAAELVIAKKELEFQNEEKEKRAAELVIANKELIFQNEEKEKRAAELVISKKDLKEALMGTVEVAMVLADLRDPYTAHHARRVAELAVTISAELGFDEQRQEGMRVAGYLHDVGKIIVPVEILSRSGKLDVNEYNMVKEHAQAGYDVLKSVNFLWPIAEVARQHHERLDGTGYPQGLKGEDIIIEARILAVADVIEAMSSHQPYRAALGIDIALAEIERGRGTAYDADVVDVVLRLFRKKGYKMPK
jgi:putative nucleotidyltransferase with HDIG domain